MYIEAYSPKLQKQIQEGNIHPSIINKAAQQVIRKPKQRSYKDYTSKIKMNGSSLFLAYRFQDERMGLTVIYIKTARWIK